MWSSCSRFRLALTPSMMWPRDAPRAFAPGPVSPKTLVATTTFSRGTFRFFSAWPVICSGQAVGVDVGGVDEVDAGVERLADEALGLVLLQLADLGSRCRRAAAEGHGAEAELGDEQAGAAEGVVAHGQGSLVMWCEL